ncbi:hypothetical protein HPB49_008112 [Dermacentor silvarum]|uniref:Uncharacterized protein n=1 Tax=Dermacentor silvarum TaxID=543639 RepID=A0ACB8CQQ5_DERSI|nr:hypothetical protein HPB49_008112 [Dermacentor silvarum]
MLLPIDAYRQPWENDDNWELRREFLAANDGLVEEAFLNMRTLRCTYPAEVRSKVRELSKNVERLPELLARRRENRKMLLAIQPMPTVINQKSRFLPLPLQCTLN